MSPRKLDWCVAELVTCDHHQYSSPPKRSCFFRHDLLTLFSVPSYCLVFHSPYRDFQPLDCSSAASHPVSPLFCCSFSSTACRCPPFRPRSSIFSPTCLLWGDNPMVLCRLHTAEAANVTVSGKIPYGREAKVTDVCSHKHIVTSRVTPCLVWHHFTGKLLSPHSKSHNLCFISFLCKCAFVESAGFMFLLIEPLPLV